MHNYYDIFTYAFASLFAIINPIGMSAVFLSMTQSHAREIRHRMAYQVATYGAILLIVTFFVGPFVLRFFGISLANIQIAGGLFVFYYSWRMVTIKPKLPRQEELEIDTQQDIVFFPLTMPITAGAGSMAVTLAFSARLASTHSFQGPDILAVTLAILLVFVVVALCYRFSDFIFSKLGATGTHVMSTLAAFILLAVSINLIAQGVLGLLTPLLAHQP